MKKKCRVYKPQSMQQGGQYDNMMTQDSIRDIQRQNMFQDLSQETPIDSQALYLKDGQYIPVNQESNKKRVSPKFIDPIVLNKQKGGEPTMTQDSQHDPVYLEKTNNFMNWLHNSSDAAQVKSQLKADMEAMDNGSFYQVGGNIEQRSGYESGNYGQKEDSNYGMYQQAYQDSNPDFMANLGEIAQNAMGMFTGKKDAQPMNGAIYGDTPNAAPVSSGFGAQPGGFGEGTKKGFQLTNPNFMQQGGGYPGYALDLIPEVDTETVENVFGTNYQTEQDYNQQVNPNDMKEFVPGGPDDPFQEDKKRNIFSSDPYKSNARHQNEAQGMIAGMNVLTGIGNYADRRKQEEELKNRFSNVFQTHGTAGADRGDYLANAPGVGTNFKPNQTTLMGYNTKIAQQGGQYNQDDELELSEAEINNLIAQGYNLEYLD